MSTDLDSTPSTDPAATAPGSVRGSGGAHADATDTVRTDSGPASAGAANTAPANTGRTDADSADADRTDTRRTSADSADADPADADRTDADPVDAPDRTGQSPPYPDGTGPGRPRPRAAHGVLHDLVIDWFDEHARDLPWRRPDAGAWSVMVSEFMLQQTPVSRVLPVHEQWLTRWPRPADLAAESPGEAVRAWGRLGYPRRALRLHAAATAIEQRHGGEVPHDHAELLALPGVGEYTAAAVASFAYGRRHIVLDTNVRRVFARAVTGVEFPPNATTAAERRTAAGLLPADEATAARWAAATMELGALVCTARTPRCGACPVAALCAWRLAGSPAHDGPPRRGQTYAGTDRQVRGRLLAVLRASADPVPQAALDAVWHEPVQRARALDGLVEDGLVEPLADGVYRLPV